MPHLSFEYSAGVEGRVDLPAFAAMLRDAMVATGIFPLGGIRVRGHRADIAVVADGGPHDFIDMRLRIGAGREDEAKARAAEMIYEAAETWLQARVGPGGFALSFEMIEIDPGFSIKRYNTIRNHLQSSEQT
ncbi:MAG: 5-carboxymethyl-2-hydroxymuconate isomerase [Pikeienuella sp.]